VNRPERHAKRLRAFTADLFDDLKRALAREISRQRVGGASEQAEGCSSDKAEIDGAATP
jgi:hypothetical protein